MYRSKRGRGVRLTAELFPCLTKKGKRLAILKRVRQLSQGKARNGLPGFPATPTIPSQSTHRRPASKRATEKAREALAAASQQKAKKSISAEALEAAQYFFLWTTFVFVLESPTSTRFVSLPLAD